MNIQTISSSDEYNIRRYVNSHGEAVITCYQVFAGVQLSYYDVHMESGQIEQNASGNILEILHCREGRMEYNCKDEFFYLSSGDLSIMRKQNTAHISYFPLSHYHGISILIDMERAPGCLSCFLSDVNVKPMELAEKYCGKNSFYLARSKPYTAHIFSELYSVPESIRKGYFKVKILELLLFLSGTEPENERKRRCSCSRAQTELAKEICGYLTEHMEEHITLAQLSGKFHISETQIKTIFKNVYGMSVYSYIRTQKMQSAALMLSHSEQSILDIAGNYGYSNGSKFSSAFKDVMGITPNEYRTQNRHN